MNKTMFLKMIALLMSLMILCGVACAESVVYDPVALNSNMPERGLNFPFTETDVNELSLGATFFVDATEEIPELPGAFITFTDAEGLEKLMQSVTPEQMNDPDFMMKILLAAFDTNHTLYSIVLFKKDYYDAQIAAGKLENVMLDSEDAAVLGENDGYVYVGIANYGETLALMETDTQKAAAEKAIARCKEIVANLSYQPVVFAEGEFTEIPEGAMIFSTQDLNGNVVSNEIFTGKKLTVLNVWGTFCAPCIEEMPELAEWSQNMPEDVQLVGLVSDLHNYDDAEILETAQLICEATGAEVYTNLVANEDFTEMLDGVVGVPTIYFINEKGEVVGAPVIGANVDACKEFVDSYIAE